MQANARYIGGADTLTSSRDFCIEFISLLKDLKAFIAELRETKNGFALRKLLLTLVTIQKNFLTLANTHVPNYEKRLLDQDFDKVEPHDIAWAKAADQLSRYIQKTFTEELADYEKGTFETASLQVNNN